MPGTLIDLLVLATSDEVLREKFRIDMENPAMDPNYISAWLKRDYGLDVPGDEIIKLRRINTDVASGLAATARPLPKY